MQSVQFFVLFEILFLMWRFNKTIVECTTKIDDFLIKDQASKIHTSS